MNDSTGKWLRQIATEIRDQGINGWGNTCEQAADDYDALRSRCEFLLGVIDAREARLAAANAAFEVEQTEKWAMAGRLAAAEGLLRVASATDPFQSIELFLVWREAVRTFLSAAPAGEKATASQPTVSVK